MPPLPGDDELLTWTDARFFEYGMDSWMWGERCAKTNAMNEAYFFCNIQKNKDACDRLKSFKKD